MTNWSFFGIYWKRLKKIRFDGKVLIKFHPATRDLRKYDKIGKDFKIRLAFVRSGSENAVKSADLIFGATSAFFIGSRFGGQNRRQLPARVAGRRPHCPLGDLALPA